MRPYKKRSYYAPENNELENSDGSENQKSPSAADIEKDKEDNDDAEKKHRKKYKRKISRKQFRHHDIKLFTPGEYRTSTLLKQKEQVIPKKSEAPSREAITDSIVTSLGGEGQNKQSFSPRRTRSKDKKEQNNSQNGVEENNNTNTVQNNNTIGKHHLPAIIMETPKIRRISQDVNPPPKYTIPLKTFVSPNVTNNTSQNRTKSVADMPSLNNIDEHLTDIHDKQSETPCEEFQKPLENHTIMNQAVIRNDELRGQNIENMEASQKNRTRLKFVVKRPDENPKTSFNKQSTNVEKDTQIRTIIAPEQTENVEDQPMDLSKKVSPIILRIFKSHPRNKSHQITFTKNPNVTKLVYKNGYYEESSPMKTNREVIPSLLQGSNRVSPTEPVKEPTSHITAITLNNGSRHATEVSVGHINQMYDKEEGLTRNGRITLASSQSNSAELYPKENPPRKEPHNIPPNLLTENVIKITNLNMWQEVLNRFMGQKFNAQTLDIMSHAYTQLESIKSEPCIPADVRVRAENILFKAYNYIALKLQEEFGFGLNPIDVIKILSQSESSPDKLALHRNLEEIQRLRNINDCSASRIIPASINKFIAAHNKYMEKLGEITSNPAHTTGQIPSSQRITPPKPSCASPQQNIEKPQPKKPPKPRRPRQQYPVVTTTQPVPVITPIGYPAVSPGYPGVIQMQPPPPYHAGYYQANHIVGVPYINQQNEVRYNPSELSTRSNVEINQPLKTTQHIGGAENPHFCHGYPYVASQFRRVPAIQNPNAFLMPQNSPTQQPVVENDTSNVGRFQTSMLPRLLRRKIIQINKADENSRYAYSEQPQTVPVKLAPAKLLGGLSLKENPFQKKPDQLNQNNTQPPSYPVENRISGASNAPLESTLTISKPDISREKINTVGNKISVVPSKTPESTKSVSVPSVTKENADNIATRIVEKQKTVPAVIVADTSMQITKEPKKASTKDQATDMTEETDIRLTVITKNGVDASPKESPNQTSNKDAEDDNPAFQVWLEKLKSDEKLKRKFLRKMGVIKRDEPVPIVKKDEILDPADSIEIVDSDEEKLPDVNKLDSCEIPIISLLADDSPEPKQEKPVPNAPKPNQLEKSGPKQPQLQTSSTQAKSDSIEHVATKTIPSNLSLPRQSTVPKETTSSTPKPPLDNSEYKSNVSIPYISKSVGIDVEAEREGDSTEDKKKTIYSPQIEPISPPVVTETSFAFPPKTIITSTMPPLHAGDNKDLLSRKSIITSSPYVQKRKLPLPNRRQSLHEPRKFSETKRRKSLDRPQIAVSPRVAPSGKLCYVRDSHMFLRYFDDSQVELFMKNLSACEEETPVKKSYINNTNFGGFGTSKTEIVYLPKDVEFSRKEDIPDVEEFVKESNLVEKYVPKDFGDFYRYVTGFQIIKHKHPVSFQTFLTMYNTNRTMELLRKYLQTDEDASEARF